MPEPIERTRERDLRRQITYTETLIDRVYRKADDKATEYRQRIENFKAELTALENNN